MKKPAAPFSLAASDFVERDLIKYGCLAQVRDHYNGVEFCGVIIEHGPFSGTVVDYNRPHETWLVRTADGDVLSARRDEITAVKDYEEYLIDMVTPDALCLENVLGWLYDLGINRKQTSKLAAIVCDAWRRNRSERLLKGFRIVVDGPLRRTGAAKES